MAIPEKETRLVEDIFSWIDRRRSKASVDGCALGTFVCVTMDGREKKGRRIIRRCLCVFTG